MNWRKIKLGDIADFSNGINFRKEAYGKGIKLIGVSNFGNRFYPDYNELEELREDIVRESDCLQTGDIVFVRSNGNKERVGRCMLVDNPTAKVTFSGFCIRARLKNIEEQNPMFWLYHFKNQSFRKAMSGTAIGANIQNLSQGRLAAYEAEVPNIDAQRRIADILSKYDELIKNNQMQIKLLEEAAQRLYKEWFVDLRFPGYEDCKVIDGIPKGWKIKRIKELGEIITGKTPSTIRSAYYGGNIPFIKIPDMHNVVYPLTTEVTLTEEGANTQKNKFIPKNSIMISCIATVGLVNISAEKCQTNQQINSIVLKQEKILYFVYSAMKQIDKLLDGIGSNGATMTNVNKKKFENIELLMPTDGLVYRYNKLCEPLFGKIYSLNKSILDAKKVRDMLLPRLMGGTLEV